MKRTLSAAGSVRDRLWLSRRGDLMERRLMLMRTTMALTRPCFPFLARLAFIVAYAITSSAFCLRIFVRTLIFAVTGTVMLAAVSAVRIGADNAVELQPA